MKKLVILLIGLLWAGEVRGECRVVGVVEGVEEGMLYVREGGLDEFYYEMRVGKELEKAVKEIRGSVQVVIVTDDLVCPTPVRTGMQELGNVVSVEMK